MHRRPVPNCHPEHKTVTPSEAQPESRDKAVKVSKDVIFILRRCPTSAPGFGRCGSCLIHPRFPKPGKRGARGCPRQAQLVWDNLRTSRCVRATKEVASPRRAEDVRLGHLCIFSKNFGGFFQFACGVQIVGAFDVEARALSLTRLRRLNAFL
jgi:hypothetical protein